MEKRFRHFLQNILKNSVHREPYFISSKVGIRVIETQVVPAFFFASRSPSPRLIQTLNKRTLMHIPFINLIAHTCTKSELNHILFAQVIKYVNQSYFVSSHIVFVPNSHRHYFTSHQLLLPYL